MAFSSYKGKYSVTTRNITPTEPRGCSLIGNTIYVYSGSVQQVMGGIQFYAGEIPFSFGYNYLECIKDENGTILWENYNKV
jgi:hypothetical protein